MTQKPSRWEQPRDGLVVQHGDSSDRTASTTADFEREGDKREAALAHDLVEIGQALVVGKPQVTADEMDFEIVLAWLFPS